jgi:hypothetical protein
MTEIKTYNLVKVIYTVPSGSLNWNVVEDGVITDEVEFMRLAQSIGDVYTSIHEYQDRVNNGSHDEDYILIK